MGRKAALRAAGSDKLLHERGRFLIMTHLAGREDGDTASGIYECFVGDVVGRRMRVKITGVGTGAAAYFVTSIGVDFWN